MRATRAAGAVLVAAIAAAGCPKAGAPRDDVVPALLTAADHAWQTRAVDGLDPVEAALSSAWQADRENRDVLWRYVRFEIARGLAAEDERTAVSAFAEGRALGIQCLDTAPAFAHVRREEGWGPALEAAPNELGTCAAWTALSWVRWISLEGGEAASLDLDAVDALVGFSRRAVEVAAVTPSRRKGNAEVQRRTRDRRAAVWAEGLLAAVRPAWAGRDPARARQTLEALDLKDDDAIIRNADLLARLARPDGDTAWEATLVEALTTATPRVPEAVRARDAAIAPR